MATSESGFDLAYAMTLPPAEAVAYFQKKGVQVSENWYDLLGIVRDRVFTVAGVAKLDVLQAIKDALDKALAENLGFADFKKQLVPILQAKGWWGREETVDTGTGEITQVQLGSPFRLKLIYRNNLQTAFMAGRRERQLANSEDRPYWQYVAVMDSRTRPMHRALHGRVFRYDDAFCGAFYPPNGHNCRCRMRALDSSAVGNEPGQTPLSSSEGVLDWVEMPVSRRQPEAGTIPVARFEYNKGRHVTTDPGWSHAPGAGWEPDLQGYDRKLAGAYQAAQRTGKGTP